jgi:4,4'-diaponeurosporenoate glycosyltransferase
VTPARVSLSAVVPATDDPPTLAVALEAIAGADDPPEEVLEVTEPGPGHAAAARNAGATRAAGDVLVFVDADVRFEPGGFDRVLATLADTEGLVSVQPFHQPGTPVEHLAALFNVVAVAATDTASPLGRRAGTRGAFGPVLACRRAHHEQVGGHAGVRGRVDEDVALADEFRRAGLEVRVVAGGDDVSFRMYPKGFGQLIEGFTKVLATGAAAARRTTVALVVAWTTLLVQAAVAPARVALGGGTGWAWALGLYLVVTGQVWWMARRVGRFGPLTALAFPVLLAVFLFVFARSVVATARGTVSWRGRRLAPRR